MLGVGVAVGGTVGAIVGAMVAVGINGVNVDEMLLVHSSVPSGCGVQHFVAPSGVISQTGTPWALTEAQSINASTTVANIAMLIKFRLRFIIGTALSI